MSKQEISVFLETFSFFFVGIDLYGQERLRKMQENFLSVSEKIKSRVTNFQEYEWSKNRRSKFMKTVYVIAGIITLTLFIAMLIDVKATIRVEQLKDWVFWLQLLGVILFLGFFYGGILLGVLVAIVIILILMIAIMQLINWIIQGAMWAFRFYQIEGVFLFFGTILFLLSKYYQLYA